VVRWVGKGRGRNRFAVLATSGIAAALLAACGQGAEPGADAGGAGGGDYVIGVSNMTVGNGWREEMICAVKAEALASGKVSNVVVSSENGGVPEQIANIRELVSQGVDAMIVNPTSPDQLNNVLDQAAERGITVVSVDQAVTTDKALVASNDQEAYGRLGAEWLVEQLGGAGTVVELRGGQGAPADIARHTGFLSVMEQHPQIQVVERYTNWSFSEANQIMLDLLNSSQQIDGVWTSGQDYTVVNAFQTLGRPFVPIVGADTNEFINQMIELKDEGLVAAAVTNPATIGGVGASIAISALEGQNVERVTQLEPELYTTAMSDEELRAHYLPEQPPTYSTQLQIEPHTHYSVEQLLACKGPGEQAR
jgi:ribose transport system substrate-binding protein